MDSIRNPYSPGAGTPPPYLAGREGLLDVFATVIGRAQIGNAVQPPVLSGLRGVGKTVLLLRWRELALEAGWAAAHIEARMGTDLRAPLGDAVIDLKGLVYAPDRGLIEFTVPHMAAYLRGRTDHPPSDP